jgi:hypothetical protein
MTEFFNFHDSWFVVEYHWVWMLLALGIGIATGWVTSGREQN